MNLAEQLAELDAAQLVHRTDDADLSYIFKHALVQDSAYQSLLKQARKHLHRIVGEALEAAYPQLLNENAALLAQHFERAGNDAKALEFLLRAGDVAARVYANSEALAHYSRALDLARRDPATDSHLLCDLFLHRGRVMELSSEFKNALANYDDAENLARERDDRTLALAAITAQCQIRCTANSEFDAALGEPLAKRALQLAQELGDRATESKILWILVNLYRLTYRLPQARAFGEQSLEIARALDLREQMAYTLNDLAHAYGFSGNVKQGRESIQEATRLWRELGNVPMVADSLATASLYDTFFGEFDEAIALSGEAYRLSQSSGNLWGQTYCLQAVGSVYWMRGEMSRAMGVMEEALRLSEHSGYPVPQLSTRAELGMALGSLGALEQGLDQARRALDFANSDYPALASFARGALVQIYLWLNQPEEAAAVFRRSTSDAHPEDVFALNFKYQSAARLSFAQSDYESALDASSRWVEWLKAVTMRTHLPEGLYLQGLAERALGQTQAARASLLQARQRAEQLQARWFLWQILSALGEMEAAGGNRAESGKCFAQAHELIRYIADHAPGELRESFLDLSHVRKVEDSYVAK